MRGSARRFLVCIARRESSSSGEPSGALATLTSEQYGSPEPGVSVASAPERASRSSFFAADLGSKSGAGGNKALSHFGPCLQASRWKSPTRFGALREG